MAVFVYLVFEHRRF